MSASNAPRELSLARPDWSDASVALAGAEQLDLRATGRLWVVETGRVELYYAERHRVHGVGTRRFLFDVEPNHVIADLLAPVGDLDVEVFGIGIDASLRPVRAVRFVEWLNQPHNASVGDALLAAWIGRLAGRLTASHMPARNIALPVGELVHLPTAEAARPERELCWVMAVSGKCCVAGRPELVVERGEVVPVSSDLWVQADDAETIIRTLSTQDLVTTRDVIDPLVRFNQKLLAAIVAEDREVAARERERLRVKTEEEARLVDRSYHLLGSVLGGKKPDGAPHATLTTLPLVEAARLVCRDQGMELEPPPDAHAGHRVRIRDPVEALARTSKIPSRKVILRGEWWKQDSGPLLAFVQQDGRPVALVRGRRSRYTMHDPTTGVKSPVNAEVAMTLRPTAYMFLRSFGASTLTPVALWKLGLRGIRRDFRSVIFLSGLTGLMALATPILSQILFDDIVPQANRAQLPVIATVLLVFAVVSAALGLVQGLVLLRVEAKMEMNMEAALMDRLLRLPAAFFKKFLAGDLAQRILGIAAIRNAVTGTTLTAILSGVFSIISLLLLIYYDTTLAILGFALAIAAVAVILTSSLVALRYNRKLTELAGQISGLVLQLMSSIAKLRTAAAEQRAFGVWAAKFAKQRRHAYRAGAVQNNFAIFEAAYPLLTSILFFGAIYWATERTLGSQGSITTGAFIAVIIAFGQFLGGMLGLGSTAISVLEVVPYYERMTPILEAQPEIGPDRVDPGRLSGDIELTNVTFRYAEDGPVILNDVSLRVRPGKMVALVGPSGSGKSTLVRLLLGFEHPEVGAIYYDGKDLSGLDLDAVRRQCGVVLQHGHLAQGDILSNIVGPWNLTLEDAWAAARMVGLKDDIDAMPMGMHTLVSEDGGTFSGGQKQRLMIARAIVHEPTILLLDEATSALDNRTQRIVSDSLKRMNITRVVIAHRLSTIQEADWIYVLDAGRIVESGTYGSLLETGGQFAQLAQRQMV